MERNLNAKKIGDQRFSLDVRGLTCPYPQMLTVRVLENLSHDDVLEVILDNPPSVKDVPPALKDRGYEVLDVISLDPNTWKIIVQAKK